MTFQKGHKYGPKPGENRAVPGRKAAHTKLRNLCLKHVPRVLEFWLEILEDPNAGTRERVKVSELIMDRALGKAHQSMSLEDGEGGPAKLVVEVVTK